MHFITIIYNTILNALFPLSKSEEELFAMNEETAFETLPEAPPVPIEAFSVFAYKDEKVSKLIWNIKYKKSEKAIKIASYALFKKIQKILSNMFLDENVLPSKIILLPIPISKRRRRERGFNQCELLLQEIERLQNNASIRNDKFILHFNHKLLIRGKHSSRQTLKHRQERLKDAKDIFSVDYEEFENVIKEVQLENVLFIIIDDVITTGSTMLDAVKVLREVGAQKIISLSVAH